MTDTTLLVTELSTVVGLAGLILVFLPFFLQRLGANRESMPVKVTRHITALTWGVGLSLLVPTIAATTALITLWDGKDLSVFTDVLTLASIWLVFVLAMIAIGVEGIWSR